MWMESAVLENEDEIRNSWFHSCHFCNSEDSKAEYAIGRTKNEYHLRDDIRSDIAPGSILPNGTEGYRKQC